MNRRLGPPPLGFMHFEFDNPLGTEDRSTYREFRRSFLAFSQRVAQKSRLAVFLWPQKVDEGA